MIFEKQNLNLIEGPTAVHFESPDSKSKQADVGSFLLNGDKKLKIVTDVKAEELKKRNGDVKGYRYTAIFSDGSEAVIRKCSNRLHDNAFVGDKPLEFESFKRDRGFAKGQIVESIFTIHKKHLAGVKGYEYYGSAKPERCDPERLESWCFGIRPDSQWGTHYSVKTFPLRKENS